MVYLTKDAQLKGLPNGIQKNDIYMNVHGIDGYINISKLLSIDI